MERAQTIILLTFRIIQLCLLKGENMDNLIAYCGIDCAVCPAYIAKKNNDDALRQKTAQ